MEPLSTYNGVQVSLVKSMETLNTDVHYCNFIMFDILQIKRSHFTSASVPPGPRNQFVSFDRPTEELPFGF